MRCLSRSRAAGPVRGGTAPGVRDADGEPGEGAEREHWESEMCTGSPGEREHQRVREMSRERMPHGTSRATGSGCPAEMGWALEPRGVRWLGVRDDRWDPPAVGAPVDAGGALGAQQHAVTPNRRLWLAGTEAAVGAQC